MLSMTMADGDRWAVLARRGNLDRCCIPGANSRISFGPSRYQSGEISWEGQVRGYELGMQLGYEEQKPRSAGRGNGVFGFMRWSKRFDTN
jgi:hypothetical protein